MRRDFGAFVVMASFRYQKVVKVVAKNREHDVSQVWTFGFDF
jgi:hypothetical protein